MIKVEIRGAREMENRLIDEKKPKKLFQDFLPLSILAIIFTAVLILTKILVAPILIKNKNNEVLEYIKSFEPEATEAVVLENDNYPLGVNIVYQNTKSKTIVMDLTVLGYGGEINGLVAVDKNSMVSGILIITHKETPGIGSELMEYNYLKNYNGLTIEDFKDYIETDNTTAPVDIISGSTVTSNAINGLVHLGLKVDEMSR